MDGGEMDWLDSLSGYGGNAVCCWLVGSQERRVEKSAKNYAG
jgi:hypothetical protein